MTTDNIKERRSECLERDFQGQSRCQNGPRSVNNRSNSFITTVVDLFNLQSSRSSFINGGIRLAAHYCYSFLSIFIPLISTSKVGHISLSTRVVVDLDARHPNSDFTAISC
jgi:hypothetical protein